MTNILSSCCPKIMCHGEEIFQGLAGNPSLGNKFEWKNETWKAIVIVEVSKWLRDLIPKREEFESLMSIYHWTFPEIIWGPNQTFCRWDKIPEFSSIAFQNCRLSWAMIDASFHGKIQTENSCSQQILGWVLALHLNIAQFLVWWQVPIPVRVDVRSSLCIVQGRSNLNDKLIRSNREKWVKIENLTRRTYCWSKVCHIYQKCHSFAGKWSIIAWNQKNVINLKLLWQKNSK